MTQVDLETLASVCGVGGGDRKIACETLTEESEDPGIEENALGDCPPESFWLSKDAEYDWFDRNAFLDRNESIKGKSNSMNLNPSNSKTNGTSLQFSSFLKSKAAIISLPKAQKTNPVDLKRRNCKLASIWLFPKRSDSIGKEPTAVLMAEPSSPKVSCLGRVRSKRCRNRRKSNEPAKGLQKPANQLEQTDLVQNSGFVSLLKSLFRFDCHRSRKPKQVSLKIDEPLECLTPRRNIVTCNQINDNQESPSEPPALGEAARFSSGRRSETWYATEMLT